MFLYVLSTQHLSPGYLVSFLKYEIAEIVTKLPKGEKINNTTKLRTEFFLISPLTTFQFSRFIKRMLAKSLRF